MSEYDDAFGDDNVADGQPQNPMSQLRKALKAKDEALAAQAKANEAMAAQLRSLTVKDTLRELGVPGKVAALVPSTVEPTAEAVKQWFDEYRDVFGLKPAEVAKQQEEAPPVSPTAATPEQVEAWARMQGPSAAVATAPDAEQALAAQLGQMAAAANGSFDQYIAYLRGDEKLPTT